MWQCNMKLKNYKQYFMSNSNEFIQIIIGIVLCKIRKNGGDKCYKQKIQRLNKIIKQ